MTDHAHHYRATCSWSGSTTSGYEAYSRSHAATAPPATETLQLSADRAFLGEPEALNPESLLLMAACSCQLLSFLAVSARARIDVVSYQDEAEATMPERDRPVRITEIRLRPQIAVRAPATERRVLHLTDLAHRECYIANSLNTEISVAPTVTIIDATT